MRIVIQHDMGKVIAGFTDLERTQIPFAAALALTRTAQVAQRDVIASLPGRFTLRRP